MSNRFRSASGVLALGALALVLVTAPVDARSHGIMQGADWPAFDSLEGVEDGALDRAAFRALVEARIAERAAERAEARQDMRAARQGARLDALVDHLMEGASDGTLDADALRAGLEDWMETQRAARDARRAGMDARSVRGHWPRAGGRMMQPRGSGAAMPERALSRLFGFFDADGDGRISEAEYEAAVARLEARAARGQGRWR